MPLSPEVTAAIIGGLIATIPTSIFSILSNKAQDKRLEAQHKHEREKEERAFKRAKLEELYVQFTKFREDIAFYHGALAHRKIRDEDVKHHEKKLEEYKVFFGKAALVEAIVNLHYPNLAESFGEVRKVIKKLQRLTPVTDPEYEAMSAKTFLDSLLDATEGFEKSCDKFKEEIIALIDTETMNTSP